MLCAPVMRGRLIASHVPSALQHAGRMERKTACSVGNAGIFAVLRRLTFLAAQQDKAQVSCLQRWMI
jgi:hypothetical protein